MKRIVFALAFLVSLSAIAQDSREKTVGEFTDLKVYDLIAVKLVKSDVDKVVISGKNVNDVQVINKDGKLKIRMKLEEIFDGNRTRVVLHYTNVDVLDANEGAYIFSDDVLKQYELDLNAQEGSKIKVDIETTYLNVRSVTGSNVTATGTSKYQDISLFTAGIYQGEHMKSEYTDVAIRAAGEAYIYTSKAVDAKVRAGGDIFIYGNPEKVDEDRVFGGRIKRMD